ncbi:hypothetical protein N7539_002632 [Penicillium diatomitis]|uniref:DUF4484 domain-containing protein n=1 Tax=Penicillium diatomitis TaxID=2819901 RepID=A0A9X0BYT7_9EURO|nr:uncharacterized protein N7539_002632 [Penicillium diatomitis]KAJ5491065.1 hypothetical protein N7539_002632 [Penicillium diatomitis]
MPPDMTRKPTAIEIPRPAMESPPGIAALFVIRFDIRTGYVISWKRTVPGVEIEGVVEYKSLPSGSHNVQEDLIYFVHDEYAGISAFLNQPAEEAERNAKMFAVGVLVPRSSGRLGKSWRHAPRLKELAQNYSADMTDEQSLSAYWDAFKIGGSNAAAVESPVESPINQRVRPNSKPSVRHTRAFSDAMVLETARPALTPFHPASSLPGFIESFGPLIFPLHRAALLRKRILIMAEAPVHTPCNYVYDLSLLASLPNSLLQVLPADNVLPLRPRPLFNVGIHDIPDLASYDAAGSTHNVEKDPSWIACSTDSVLCMKPDLYDVLVTMAPAHAQQAEGRAFPKITCVDRSSTKPNATSSVGLKATQRDARRYGMLRRGLRKLSHDDAASIDSLESDATSTYSSSTMVEPLSWTRLAYTSFIWWASAGEARDGLSEDEEEHQIEQDARLLASVESIAYPEPNSHRPSAVPSEVQGQDAPEVALVAYFRQLTSQIFFTLAGAIARHDSGGRYENEVNDTYSDAPYLDDPNSNGGETSLSMSRQSISGDDGSTPLLRQRSHGNHTERTSGHKVDLSDDPVIITIADMADMGLDVWSATDRIIVQELVSLWWGRSAYVDSARIRCCGISVL